MTQSKTPSASAQSGKRQITRTAGLVSAATLASRILGMLRDAVIAAFFSKSATDAFFVANTIPNVFRRLLAEGTLTVAFIPVFTEYLGRDGIQGARALLAKTLGPALIVLMTVCSLCMVFAPAVVKLFAFGLAREPEKFQLAVLLTRLIFPFLLTVGLVALAMGALNTVGHFFAPAAAPVMLNVVIISVVVGATSSMRRWGMPPIATAALGIVLGGIAQLLMQLRPLAKRSLLVAPQLDWRHEGVRRVGRLMLPSIAGLAIYQLNVMLSRQFASFLAEGAISYLYYAQRLIELPIGMFATAMATVTMPNLSRHASNGDEKALKETFGFGLRLVLFVLVPATVGLVVLAEPLIAVLFQRGAFTSAMTRETATTLIGFALGLCAAGGVRQTVPVFYALQDTKTPVKVSALTLLVYGVCAVTTFRSWGTFGLALSVTVAATVNFLTLVALLRRRLGPLGLSQVVGSATRCVAVSLLCGGAAWLVARNGRWALGGAFWRNYALVAAAVGVGGVVYWWGCTLMRCREVTELRAALRRRRS